MNRFKTVVGGFLFTDENMAKKACQEEESIQYVKDRLDMGNPRIVLEMYHKLVAEQVFETPVGLLYLKELQNYLITALEAPENENFKIAPIPLPELEAPKGAVLPASRGEAAAAHKEQLPASQMTASQAETIDQETMDWYAEKLEEARQRERQAEYRMRRSEERAKESRRYLRFALFCSLFLILVTVGFGIITMTDNHPNILNYENKIIEKYQNWEAELQSREQELKEKNK